MARNYTEILQLYGICKQIGIPCELAVLLDGYKLQFRSGHDFVQHGYSCRSSAGYIEPAIGCEHDYQAVTLDEAEQLVINYKDVLSHY